MLGVGGDVGYGGCEPRIEGIVQCTKRYCTILRKLKKCVSLGGGMEGQYLNPKHFQCIHKKRKKKSKKKSQGGCERRIEVFVKIQRKKSGGGGGWGWGSGLFFWGGQGGCERRIEVLV